MARRRTRAVLAAGALALTLAGAAGTAGAATYYVATGGSDGNPGTSAAPFKTLQAGVNAAHGGDTIIVQDGTYGPTGPSGSMGVTITKAGSSGAYITLQAAHQGAAILDCQGVCHSYIDFASGSAYWIVKGFDIRNGMWSGIFANSMAAGHIQILDNVIHNIGNRYDSSSIGIMGLYTDAGANNWRIDGNVFHDIGRTAVLTGTHDHGIYTHGSSMVIVNNIFYNLKNGWHIQTAAGFSGTIANNTFYGPDPVSGTVGQVMLWDATSNLTVRNNIFYGGNSVGITTYALSISGPCTIDHNLTYTSGQNVPVTYPTPSGCTETAEKLNVDPKFANAGSRDFRLSAGSPAIDAGASVSGTTDDFAGAARPQGGAYDIGAYEYGGSAGSSTGGTTTAPAGCTQAVPPAWYNVSLTRQTGSFTLQWDATPSSKPMDGLMGAANGSATDYTSLAAIVRFNNAGFIDARNGGTYSAAASIPYSAGLPYHFRLAVDLASHKYSAYVKQGSNAEQLIGSNYAFRTEQAAVAALSGLGLNTSSGAETICNAASVAAAAPAPAPAPSPTPTPVPSGCTLGSPGAWTGVAVARQTGAYTLEFDATPSQAKMDGLLGACSGVPSGYSSLATCVRFNNAGFIDARNGGAYGAAASIPYSAGASYHIRMVINLPAHTYSAYVKQGSAAEQLIGSNYAFRTEQAAVSSLDHVGLNTSVGNETMCNPTASAAAAPSPTPATANCVTGASGVWKNEAVGTLTGSFTVAFDATPGGGAVDGLIGLSNGAATSYAKMAAIVRFNTAGKIDARNGANYAAAASIPYTAGKAYHFRLVVNASAHTYSAYVSPAGGSEVLIGSNYKFRTEVGSLSTLTNLAAMSDAGSQTLCSLTVNATAITLK